MKRKIRFSLLSLVLMQMLNAQQFGGFPPSTRWKQINTDTARIIFVRGAEWQANRIAGLIHKAAADTTLSLGNRIRKINVLLQSRTTMANGYVALAPYRSEFYLVPGSNIFDFGNLPWYEQLALHEYRHVQQYNNFNHGLSKAFGYLFGEQGVALATAITVPDWFFEGDAVHSETALTPQGRGRQALFLSGYNSLWREGKNYSWHKLRNGSLKDYVPSHYQLGYLLTNYGYLKYGDDFWQKVTQDASAFKGLFYPFQAAVKRYAGVNYKTFRKEALEFYSSKLPASKPAPSSQKKTVTNFYFPQFINHDSLVYLKKAYNSLAAFYIRDRNGEHKISRQHVSSEEWFSYRNGMIAYTAFSTDPRWTLVDYSDIVLLNIRTGHEKRITGRERYFTPDLSPSGNRIVAVKMTDSLKSELHLLSADGSKISVITAGDGFLHVNPRFVDENRIVVGIRKPDSKITLQLIDLSASQKPEQLIPETFSTVGLPFVKNDTIYFVAGFHGNDDLYALKLKDRKIFRLTTGATGHYYPSAFGDTVVWSHFTAEGLELRTAAIRNFEWAPVDAMEVGEQPSFYPVAFPSNILNARTERFSAKRYSRSTGLFNFHSWAPAYSDPEFTFSLYGDNVLNTFSNEIYYRYNQNENSHGFGWNTAYGGLYPVLSAGVEYTYNRELPFRSNILTLDQLEARVGYNIPLNITKGTMYRLLNFGSNFVFNRTIPTGFYKDTFEARNRTYLHHFITWQHYLPRAVQHIYPKFGYTLTANVRHFTNENLSENFNHNAQWLLGGQLFLPSVFRTHSVVLAGSFQSVDTLSTSFANRFSNSRGYSDYYFRKMWRLSANYHFPIAYPDLGFANIVYLQRLRGNLFFDYTRVFDGYFGKPPTASADMRSAGAEVFFDTKWWNQLPVSFGIRISRLLDNGFRRGDEKGSTWFEVILPVGLIPN